MSTVAVFLVALASLPSASCGGVPSGVLLNYDRVAQLIVEASQMPSRDESPRGLVQGTGAITTQSATLAEETTVQTTSMDPATTTEPTTSTPLSRTTSAKPTTTTLQSTSSKQTKSATTTLPSTSSKQTTTEMTSTSKQTSKKALSMIELKNPTVQQKKKASSERVSTSEMMSSKATSTSTEASTSSLETTVTATSATSTRTQTTHTATSTSTETATSSTATTTETVTSTSTATSTRSTSTVTLTETSVTATTTSRTQTSTSSVTTVSTTTTSETATATSTTSSSATMTQTTTETTTRTETTTTISTSSSSTTTPYCFESNVQWGPIDMPGTLPSKESDEYACQEKCLRTPGCSHFSFWRLGGMCHLQDRYAQRRENREGFLSGPFQCWTYLIPGQYAKISNTSYVPARFRCMQTGVVWSPDLTVSKHFKGERDEVVFACQKQCRDTEGCAHFSVMFPGLCRLAGDTAVPLPAERAISGPPTQDCKDPTADAPVGHTFMRKYESSRARSPSSPLLRAATVGPAAVMVSAAAVAFLWGRRCSSRARAIPVPVPSDLEESLQYDPQE